MLFILFAILIVVGVVAALFRNNIFEVFAGLGVLGLCVFYILVAALSVGWPAFLIYIVWHFVSKYW